MMYSKAIYFNNANFYQFTTKMNSIKATQFYIPFAKRPWPRQGRTTREAVVQIRTLARFSYNTPTHQVSSSYVYSFGSYRVDKHTHKQTDRRR